MNKTKIFLLLIYFASIVSAQNWNAILNVIPYPSPYISDWETNPSSLGSLTLFNNTNEITDIIITSTVTHHNYGVVATSITTTIPISSAPSTLINSTLFFNSSNSQFPQQDLKDKVIRTGRLPEGTYTVCFVIRNSDNQVLVSNVCADFTIVYPEPPHLIYPLNGDSLNADNEYPTFQWTPVIVQPDYQLTYTLKIVEVLQGQTPAQALSANYPQYINNQINITSFTYPIDALKLENGKTYAWQTQALDQFGIPPAQNQGKSEIFTFTKKKFIIFPIFIINNPLLQSPANNSQVASNKPTFKWSYTPAQGKNYKFEIKICKMNSGQSNADAINNPPLYSTFLGSNQTSFTPPVYLNFSQNAGYVWRVDVINTTDNTILKSSNVWKLTYSKGIVINPVLTLPAWSFLSGQLRYKYAYKYDTESWSLANRTVKLVIKYIMKYTSNSGTGNYGSTEAPKGELLLKDSDIPGHPSDNNQTLAVTTTDANGNFSFNFINPDSMGHIKANYHIGTSAEFGYDYTGDIYRVARVIVEDEYFTSPDDDIMIQPYETKNIGSVTSLIRSYAFEVTIKPMKVIEQQFTLQPLDQMDVYLLRKKRPYGLPNTEGSPKPSVASPFPGYEVVAMGTTEGEPHKGKIIFTRLILNIAQGDNYYLYARSSKNAPHNYILFGQNFYFSDWHRDDGYHYGGPDKSGNTYYSKDTDGIYLYQDNAIYNSQYIQPIVHKDFYAFPLLPEISGSVVRSDEPGTKIKGASVLLLKVNKKQFFGKSYEFDTIEKAIFTDATGKFYFGGLHVEYSINPYVINGPVRQLWGYADGFDKKVLDVDGSAQNNALSLGERKSNQLLALNPGSIVSGNIVDEYGNGISARIKIGDAPQKTVSPTGYYYDSKNHKLVIAPAHFEFPAARLKHQSLVVTPLYNASQYIIDTTYVDITQPNQNLGNIIVYEKKHRLKFIVKEAQPWTPTLEHPFLPVYQWPPLPGAKIKITILGGYSEKTTDQYGEASFKFSNDSKNFKVIVEGPAGKYYVKKAGMVQNKPSKYDVTYVIALDKATYISGSVFVAGNQPVENADVWIDFGNPDLNIFVKTNENGKYILPNVPIGQDIIVYASKHSNTETIIGDSAAVNTAETGKTGVNLYLTIYNGMDITQLFGFPVLLTNLTEEGNGQVRITGLINKFKKNNIFDLSESQNSKLSFKNVLIKPGNKKNSKGVPYAALASPPLIFSNPSLSLNMFSKFNADFGDTQNGIQLINPGNDVGLLKGKLFVRASSFDTKGSLSNYNGLYLANPNVQNNTEKMLVPAITADGSAPLNIPDGFNVTNSSGDGLTLKINNFNAETDPHNSFFNQDTVRLRTTLHTNIAHANPSDLKLAIGDVTFHQKSIEPVIGKKEFSFKLDNWTLDASEWNFYKGNIRITKGTLNSGLNIPVKSLDVTPTSLAFGDFNLSSIAVSKIVPFTITGKFYFNHDDANDYWYLSVSKKNLNDPYAAYAKGLPGMANNDLLKISSFVLNSKESFFSLTPENQTLKIYKVGILNLNASNPLLAYDDYLYVQGLGFNIPNATQSTAFDYYKGKDGKIAFKLRGINLSANAGNGVYIKFGATPEQQNSQVLDESGFRSLGVIGEDGKFEKVSWLYHTVDSTSILVETPTTPFTIRNTYQKMIIGSANSTYLSKLTGGMIVSNNKWNNFHFEGDLTGTKGITDKHKRLSFTVYGKILADNQQISVKNVPTPFGKMKWMYQFKNSRLIGTFNIDKKFGGVKINGTAEILIDNIGWYFLGTAKMKVPGIPAGNAAMIFGDYPSMPQPVRTIFAAASYNKNLPSSFQHNISGFLFSGKIAIPVIIPNIDINLGIVALEFGVDAGGDVRIYKGFDEEGGSTYGIGAIAFIHAYLTMSAITCTTLSADATLEAGMEGNYQTGSRTFNLNGCASLSIAGHIIQSTPPFCSPVLLDIGHTFAFSAKFHIDSDGNANLKFQKGTCSGN